MTQSSQPPELPQGLPAAVVPYATPVQYQAMNATQGAWREGTLLIITKQATLPPHCVKCNVHVPDGWRWRKTLYWHHPALALLVIFPGLLIYAIVALIVRKKAIVEASLCPEHRSSRNTKLALAWLTGLGSVAVLIGGIAYGGSTKNAEWAIVVGLLGFVVLLILAVVFGGMARVLAPTKIDDNFAWLKGAGPEFLSQFPTA